MFVLWSPERSPGNAGQFNVVERIALVFALVDRRARMDR
jgi:hypothetical protein